MRKQRRSDCPPTPFRFKFSDDFTSLDRKGADILLYPIPDDDTFEIPDEEKVSIAYQAKVPGTNNHDIKMQGAAR